MIGDVNLERAVLGSVISGHYRLQEYVDHALGPADFSDRRHKHIAHVINYLVEKQIPVDPLTVVNRLWETGWTNKDGGACYVISVVELALEFVIQMHEDRVPGILAYHIAKLQEYRQLRELAIASESIMTATSKLEMSPGDLCLSLEKKVAEIRERTKTGTVDLGLAMRDRLDVLERSTAKHDIEPFMETGFSYLDRRLGGLRPGRSYIIAGYTGHGKTQLALQIGLQAAKYNYPVHFVSIEMLASELAERGLFTKSRVDHEKAENFELTANEWQQLRDTVEYCKTIPFRVGDKPRVTIADLWNQARALKARIRTQGLFVVDYLGLVLSKKQERREREVADVSQNLKAIAKQFEIPVIALSQLRRPHGDRIPRPTLSMLRESGQIEQDADVVIFVWHDEAKKKEWIIISKNRHGRRGTISMKFLNGWWGQEYQGTAEYGEGDIPF